MDNKYLSSSIVPNLKAKIPKLYTTTGNNTDGSITQKAATTTFATKADLSTASDFPLVTLQYGGKYDNPSGSPYAYYTVTSGNEDILLSSTGIFRFVFTSIGTWTEVYEPAIRLTRNGSKIYCPIQFGGYTPINGDFTTSGNYLGSWRNTWSGTGAVPAGNTVINYMNMINTTALDTYLKQNGYLATSWTYISEDDWGWKKYTKGSETKYVWFDSAPDNNVDDDFKECSLVKVPKDLQSYTAAYIQENYEVHGNINSWAIQGTYGGGAPLAIFSFSDDKYVNYLGGGTGAFKINSATVIIEKIV